MLVTNYDKSDDYCTLQMLTREVSVKSEDRAIGSLGIDLDDIKGYLRIDSSFEDDVITQLYYGAVDYVSGRLKKPIYKTTANDVADFDNPVVIGKCFIAGPVASLESITYYNSDGNPVIADVDQYSVVSKPYYGWNLRLYDITTNRIEIKSIVGFASVDVGYEDIKHAIMLRIGHDYKVREDILVQSMRSAKSLDLIIAHKKGWISSYVAHK